MILKNNYYKGGVNIMKIINLSNNKLIKFSLLANMINKTNRIKLNFKLLNNEVIELNNLKYKRSI